jgi:hypothetical protein
MVDNEKTTLRGITVAVGYGWQMFDESEPSNKDKKPKGYDVLYDAFWKSIRDKFLPKCEGVKKSLKAKISFKRLRASHGKLVWNSILKNINNADVLVFDVAAAPKAKDMPKDRSDIKDVIKSFNYNVLVEIGVALGLDKRVVLMCPDHLFDKVPSDLKGYLWTKYTGEISKEGFKRCFCDERGVQNAFMGMLREAIQEKNIEIEIEE